ncbi:unnamed protein product, partial [Closterium sp. Naga37s-1]
MSRLALGDNNARDDLQRRMRVFCGCGQIPAAGARLEHHARCCIISHVAASTGARPPLAISDDLALLQRLAHDAIAHDCNDGRTCGELQHLWRTAAPVTHGSTCDARLSSSCQGENA